MQKLISIFNTLFFSVLIIFSTHAQKGNADQVSLNWNGVKKSGLFEEAPFEYLSFDGAQYGFSNGSIMPVMAISKEMPMGTNDVNVIVTNEVYEELGAGEKNLLDLSVLSPRLQLQSRVSYARFVPYASVSFYPFIKDETGAVKKLVSFSVELFPLKKPELKKQTRSFVSSSVLADGSGDWYKIGVAKDGVHRISYSFLKDMGIDIDNIHPDRINIYGNGFGMLPEQNSQYRPDDLAKNSIFVNDGGDGVFNTDDFILFYAKGPDKWNYNTSGAYYYRTHHVYCDTSYYFINIAPSPSPKRITSVASSSLPANQTVTVFDDRVYYEPDLYNLVKSGREWFGDLFDYTTEISYSFGFPNIVTTEQAKIRAQLAAKTPGTTSPSSFTVAETGTGQSVVVSITGVGSGTYAAAANENLGVLNYYPNNATQNVKLTFNKFNSNAVGWLNWLELTARRQLVYTGSGHLLFRDASTVTPGNVSDFVVSSTAGNMQFWDVTDPANVFAIQSSYSAPNYTFRAETDTLREFAAVDPASLSNPAPLSYGKVDNQDLHSLGYADLIIITHPAFITQANELAQFHTDEGLSVHVVTTEAVYKEFSSGMRDATAIRQFLKMFYDRAGGDPSLVPENVLLFGDGSYDNKYRIGGNTAFVPTYQSYNSTIVTTSYVSDDYFVILDNGEAMFDSDRLDMGIGRLPVKTVAEANGAVNKIKSYSLNSGSVSEVNGVNCNQNSEQNMGDWRNIFAYVADDEDGGDYQDACNRFADSLEYNFPFINTEKIFLDAYIQYTTPGGQRYPDATDAIKQRVQKGALVINYIGHGGEVGWAHERILDMTTVNNWSNTPRLPLFMTATCEFSRFDDPSRSSAGEIVFTNPNGGGIALFTTTRLVYAGPNEVLNKHFNRYVLQKSNGKAQTLGEIFMRTKNGTIAELATYNTRNFTLLGDPAVRLKIPEYSIVTDSLNHVEITGATDTLKALSVITISGHVEDYTGAKLTGFNGVVYPVVYDKTQNLTTLGNDPGTPPMPFVLRKNVIYRGKASVVNGEFTFTFIVPKDIVYQYGFGKLSYYAHNGSTDGTGADSRIVVGGTNPNAPADSQGPEISLYMNSEEFVPGGITDDSPSIYAKIADENGVNTVGTSIGHDITAVIDNNTANTLKLNDYYEADFNTYKSGKVLYPLSDLEEGSHTLKFKAWDVYNNSGESTLDFVVAKSGEIALQHVLNYPNPFTTRTQFFFEHNQPCQTMKVQIQVFTVSGKLVKTFNETVQCEGYRIDPIEWDGTDDFGDRLAIGTYIYRVRLQNNEGTKAEKFEKLVILN